MDYDVVIVGGGPAGLSAALMLGRARKRVLLCDAGPPRNAAAEQVHGFVTRDGIPPREFRRIAREQLTPYTTVAVRDMRVMDIVPAGDSLRVTLENGDAVSARRVLLAVGVVDELPSIPGMREHWGKSVFQCPYCHGWEARERLWGVIANDATIAEWSLLLTGWTRDLVVFTQGTQLPADIAGRLSQAGIALEPRLVRRLVGKGHLEAAELEDGARVPLSALFIRPLQRPAPIVERLQLAKTELGFARVDERKESSVPRVHVAGDATTMLQAALMAAAEGAVAAGAINHLLTVEDALGAAAGAAAR